MTFNSLNEEQKRMVCEIAKKYPCTIEYVADLLIEKDFNCEEVERCLNQDLFMGPRWRMEISKILKSEG